MSFNASLSSLRSLLDDVNRSPQAAYKLPASSYSSPVHVHASQPYSAALNSAERSVDRLGASIEAAEVEMEQALKRTTGELPIVTRHAMLTHIFPP